MSDESKNNGYSQDAINELSKEKTMEYREPSSLVEIMKDIKKKYPKKFK
jgi:hypothetical protein